MKKTLSANSAEGMVTNSQERARFLWTFARILSENCSHAFRKFEWEQLVSGVIIPSRLHAFSLRTTTRGRNWWKSIADRDNTWRRKKILAGPSQASSRSPAFCNMTRWFRWKLNHTSKFMIRAKGSDGLSSSICASINQFSQLRFLRDSIK